MAFTDKQREKEYLHQYYLENRKKIIQRSKDWAKAHPEEVKETLRKWKEDNADRFREIARKGIAAYRKRFPERAYARSLLSSAIQAGYIVRPPSCSQCGRVCKTEGHHHNGYAPDHAFDVIWLCSACHRSRH